METIYAEKTAAIMLVVPELVAHLKRYSPLAQTTFVGLVRPNETEDLPAEFFKTKLEDAPISVDDVDEDADTNLVADQSSSESFNVNKSTLSISSVSATETTSTTSLTSTIAVQENNQQKVSIV